jgi:hypothetical protein
MINKHEEIVALEQELESFRSVRDRDGSADACAQSIERELNALRGDGADGKVSRLHS